MAVLLKFVMATCVAFTFFSQKEESAKHEYFIVVTSKLADTTELEVLQKCEDLVGKVASKGDPITVLVAPKYKRLLSFTVPSGSENGRLRNPDVEDAIDYLAYFFEATGDEVVPESEEGKKPEIDAAQLNLPVLSAAIRANRLGAKKKLPVRIILVGDPVYDDPHQAGWSMKGGTVIEHGALDSVYAKCPFAKCKNFPPGTTVAIVTESTIFGQDLEHTDAVTELLWLFFDEKKAELVGCGPNTKVGFTQFTNTFPIATPGGKPFVRDPLAGKLVRLVSRGSVSKEPDPKDVVPIIVPVRLPPKVTFVEEVPVNIDQLIADAKANPNKLLLAIHWQTEEEVDIDMWLRNNRFPAEELSWADMSTSFGELHRDVRRTQGSENVPENWEVATLNCAPEDLTLWLNCYVGPVGPKKIKMVRVWKGVKKEGFITFPGGGNKAHSYLKRSESSSWRKIRIAP